MNNDGTDIKARILKEAMRLFAQRGFSGASLDSIAQAVGIRKPSLIYHFPSKENLRTATIESIMGHWEMELPRLLADTDPGEDRFSSVMKALLEFFFSDEHRAVLAVREMLDRPYEIGGLMRERMGSWLDLVAKFITMGKTTGLVRPDVDPNAYVLQVMILVLSNVSMSKVLDSFAPTDPNLRRRMIDEMVRMARVSLYA